MTVALTTIHDHWEDHSLDYIKAMANLDSVSKSRDIALPAKVCVVCMEAEKAPHLSWSHRRADGMNSSMNAVRLKTREEPVFWLGLNTGGKTLNLSPYSQAGGIPSSSAFLF